jgi:hypothetical protein
MSTRTATTAAIELPSNIAGLWSLCALTPLRTRTQYNAAVEVCSRLAVRRLNAAQREYQRELLGLVEAYEDKHDEANKTLNRLRRLAAG